MIVAFLLALIAFSICGAIALSWSRTRALATERALPTDEHGCPRRSGFPLTVRYDDGRTSVHLDAEGTIPADLFFRSGYPDQGRGPWRASPRAAAALDSAIIGALVHWRRGWITVANGGLVGRLNRQPYGRKRMLKRIDELAALLARLEVDDADVTRRLRDNLNDPDAIVRASSLAGLVDLEPGSAAMQQACRRALEDPAEAVALVASAGLGDDGRLRERLARADTPREHHEIALAGLRRCVGPDAWRVHMVELLTDGDVPEVARLAAANTCAQEGFHPGPAVWASALEAVSERAQGGILRALERIAVADDQPLLVSLLHSRDWNVRFWAARTLGRVGTSTAIGPLRELHNRSGGDLQKAAAAAIIKLRQRASHAERGQLAIAADQRTVGPGELTIAADDRSAGALSEAED